jgi:hypothetical protein
MNKNKKIVVVLSISQIESIIRLILKSYSGIHERRVRNCLDRAMQSMLVIVTDPTSSLTATEISNYRWAASNIVDHPDQMSNYTPSTQASIRRADDKFGILIQYLK